MNVNDRRLAVELQKHMDRRVEVAIRTALTRHRYGLVFGSPDTVKRTVSVRLYGLSQPSPGFHYGTGLAPRDGDHVRVYINPAGDKWIDDILGRDMVSEIIDVVTPPAIQPDRARTGIARVINAAADFSPATVVQKAQTALNGGLTSITATFASPITPGNQVVAILTAYDENLTWDAGYVPRALTNQTIGSTPPNASRVAVAIKPNVGPGEPTTIHVSWLVMVSLAILDIVELTPGDVTAAVKLYDTGNPVDLPTVSPTGAAVLLLASISTFQGYNITVHPPGWVHEQDIQANTGSNSIVAAIYSKAIASPSGSYSGSVTYQAGVTSTGVILIFGAEAIDESSSVAPETIDADDVTYHASTLAEALRIDLRAAYRIIRARILIGPSTAGSRTYTLRAANEGDYSDEITVATMTFAAGGSYAATELTPVWPTTTAYRFWRIVGPAESRRIYTVELYETNPGETPVIDPTTGSGADVNDALAAILAAIITDHGLLSGLGDDDHPQYTTAAELVAYAQPLDADLTAIAALVTASFGRSVLTQANAAALRTLAGLVIGTDVQAFDAELAALAGLTSAADKVPYFTGSGTAGLTGLSAFIRTLLDDADAATARATLGITAAPALDDLTDVAVSSPLNAQRIRFSSATSLFENSSLVWEPMIASDGSVMTDGLLNPMQHEVPY